MPFESTEDDFDLEESFKDVVIEKNMYIADEEKAIDLIANLITNKANPAFSFKKRVEEKINFLFLSLSEILIENKLFFYERFIELCSRLLEIQKIKKIQDKVVISFGGKVSSGKSKFINSISGIGQKLPVDQKTTTAIPTYIIKSKSNSVHAVTTDGYSTEISLNGLEAMAHEFNDTYGIGFPAFVDSIIIESNEYTLSNKIALLDTPGYTKYDKENDSKMIISDRQKAYNQLSISDYLIWLIDIDSGAITKDDIEFIESLPIKTPVLIIFTKADLKSDTEITQIIEAANEIILQTNINCFGITAYSANLNKEYGDNKIINFFDFAINSSVRNNDIVNEFENIEREMREAIKKASDNSKNTVKVLFNYISNSNKILEIHSLASLWGKENQNGYELDNLLKSFDIITNEIKKEIQNFLRKGSLFSE